MATMNFNDAVSQLARQKQAVYGRPPSRNEIAGVVEGIAAESDERLSRKKGLDIQEKQVGIQQQAQDLNVQRLAEEKRQADTELQLAHEAIRRDIKTSRETTGASVAGTVGAGVGYYFGGPVGGAVGSAIGATFGKIAGGSSWICSAIHKKEPWKLSQQKCLLKLMRYAKEKHSRNFSLYQKLGEKLAIYGNKNDILPIIDMVKCGKIEKAYKRYVSMCKNIIKTHKEAA